jgi:hypothetical protein
MISAIIALQRLPGETATGEAAAHLSPPFRLFTGKVWAGLREQGQTENPCSNMKSIFGRFVPNLECGRYKSARTTDCTVYTAFSH